MIEIKLELDERQHGVFNLYEADEKLGEMVISIKDSVLTLYHTGVEEKAAGKGFAGQLLATMVTYVRNNNLMVRALCPYVHAQFKTHPEMYNDIWLKSEGDE
ncbi:GNAT family N-acetyltransferase [Flavobacterium sp. RHBU_3]|uniref:GNAT family N-acetyltransferase n=1 Tax=Flavobacterium sp. RHBU_3 TaxID=3391184 RepID=UPI0039847135